MAQPPHIFALSKNLDLRNSDTTEGIGQDRTPCVRERRSVCSILSLCASIYGWICRKCVEHISEIESVYCARLVFKPVNQRSYYTSAVWIDNPCYLSRIKEAVPLYRPYVEAKQLFEGLASGLKNMKML